MSRVALVVSALAALSAPAEVLTQASVGVDAQAPFGDSELSAPLQLVGPAVSLEAAVALSPRWSLGGALDWSYHSAGSVRFDCFDCRFLEDAHSLRVGPVVRWSFFENEQVVLFVQLSPQLALQVSRVSGGVAGGPDTRTSYSAELSIRGGALIRVTRWLQLGASLEGYGGRDRAGAVGAIVAALTL